MAEQQKKKILLYYPPNKSSVAIETLCKAMKEEGHEVLVLTLTEKGDFHTRLEQAGIACYTTVKKRKPSWLYFPGQARYLAKFCRLHRIDYVWSHLQEANIIAVLALPFLKARLVTFRHHGESGFHAEFGKAMGMQRSKMEIIFDKIINRFSPMIVVPGTEVYYSMEKYEGCNMKKVKLIRYIYDFSGYPQPDMEVVQRLKQQYDCHLRLIIVSRMVPIKQHMPLFRVMKKLADENYSVKLIVVDDAGSLRTQLETFVKDNSLEQVINMVGYRKNVIDYLAAADMMVHPSFTEASCNVVKEMALLNHTAAVCREVGDFDDYVEDGKNGFVLNRSSVEADIEKVLRHAYANKDALPEMGAALHASVLRFFSDTTENRRPYLDLLSVK
jgi:glycosyltransferase involved in cell wall biosynthesis